MIWLVSDFDYVKGKQENSFPHSEGTHTRWKDYSCIARLVIQNFMVFWHQRTPCKVINQAANSVNSDLPAFWRSPSYFTVKSFIPRQNRSPENSETRERKDLSVTLLIWSEFALFLRLVFLSCLFNSCLF